MINRDDMLELTRRMTDSRSHLVRLAGAYMDDEGYVDGTFNTNFYRLQGEERRRVLQIAKAIPFSRTNEELVEYAVPGFKPGSIWQLLYALWDCELKNDALLLSLYEYIGERAPKGRPYAIYVYCGMYDIPVKASDKTRLDESEEVYKYLIVALCPVNADMEAQLPDAGLLFPVLKNRTADSTHVNIYSRDADAVRQNVVRSMLLI